MFFITLLTECTLGIIPKVGPIALTGVGLTFPIIMLISAFSAFIGAGGAPLASIALGKGDKERAEKILGNSVSVLLIFSISLTIIFMIFKRPLLFLFGASDQTITYAVNYITIYLMGTNFRTVCSGTDNDLFPPMGHAQDCQHFRTDWSRDHITLIPFILY